MAIEAFQAYLLQFEGLTYEARVRHTDIQALERDEVCLAVRFLAVEILDGDSAGVEVDADTLSIQVASDQLLHLRMEDMLGYRRRKHCGQCKKERYS